MEFNSVIDKRRTSREWTDRDVDFEIIKRIIEAGMKAPSWDHYRNWQFIVLHTKEEKENAFSYAKYIADRFDLSRYEGRKLNLAQEMYAYAMPRQYTMLVDCPYVIVPLFKCAKLNAEWVSKLNPLTTAWCVAENIMLAAINEGLGYSLRIPLNKEHNIVLEKLGVPAEIYNKNDRRYWELLDGELKGWAAEIGLDYVTNDDSMSRPFEAPPIIVNFFYHSEIKKSARKGGERHA